jgi:hypothetical protein
MRRLWTSRSSNSERKPPSRLACHPALVFALAVPRNVDLTDSFLCQTHLHKGGLLDQDSLGRRHVGDGHCGCSGNAGRRNHPRLSSRSLLP